MKKIAILGTLTLLAATTGAFAGNAAMTNSGGPAVSGELDVLTNPIPAAGITSITAVVGTTAAPSGTLGPFVMTPIPYPGAPGCTGDTPPIATPPEVPGGVGINPGDQRCIGAGWSTWSHGYTGDVYFTEGATSQTLTMPPDTGAFYFYVEPNPFSVQTCQAVAQPGGVSTGAFDVNGDAGARYVGFYDPSGSIASIGVSCTSDFATGEYGIAPASGVGECDLDGNGDYDRRDVLRALIGSLQAREFRLFLQFLRECGLPE